MPERVGVLLVATILVGCGHGIADGSPARAIVIADGEQGPPSADVSAWQTSPAVMRAIAAARSHWSASEPGYEEKVRVMGAASGAFTRAGAEQQLVLYGMSDVPRSGPKRGLAILEGGQLLHNFAFAGLEHDVRALADIDGNGHDELVLGASFAMGGQRSSGVTLVAFGEAGPRDLGTVTVYESACDAGYEGARSARLTVVPGSPIMIQRYRQSSCASATWQPVGEPGRLALAPPQQSRYEEIPAR